MARTLSRCVGPAARRRGRSRRLRNVKRRTFEEIIHEEFRWPAAGDMPFVQAPDHLENANIAGGAHTRLVLMMEGYKKGADIMIAHTLEHEVDRDFLVCPIIFNYRQFLEL